jgi:S-adenosylmethionine:tRNA ribosyltransferase-isomerase
MSTEELNFDLPVELIAQQPSAERAASRLLHYRKTDRSISHRRFSELPGLLRKDDLLVFNDTKVLPARFVLRKQSGGRVEGLFLSEARPGRWLVLLRDLGGHRGELHFDADQNLSATLAVAGEGGQYEIELNAPEPAAAVLERIGRMPLPPYIKRAKDGDPRDVMDRDRYQTIYATHAGSVAAPTAGLHFTPQILADLDAAGVERIHVTLHVGLGTFKTVTVATLAEHVMHSEWYEISPRAADALNRARSTGRRIVAVGTTSARVLESHPPEQAWQPTKAQTAIFIYPPYAWRHVSALVTNFHLPCSTLIALVAAFTGVEEQRRLYAAAIAERYRFFSYGDAMFAE